jgi:hypothetical protein
MVVGDDADVSEAHASSIFRVEIYSEDGGTMYLRNVSIIADNCTV